MSRLKNTPLFLFLFVCILAVTGLIAAALLIAARQSVVVVVNSPAPVGAVSGVAASPTVATSEVAAGPAVPAPKPLEIVITRAAAVPQPTNVFDSAWDKAPVTDVPLMPQQNAMPMLDGATVSAVKVQALRDDKQITWRISWGVMQASQSVETGRFPDALAIQFPMVDGASIMMGSKGAPVRILHWKAIWQKDIDDGYQDIHKMYPNAWCDLYWFASGKSPFPLTEAFKNPLSRQWLIAYSAGNPMADFERKEPIEEIVAEGFGTATHVSVTPTHARGVWKDGRWTVVIQRQLEAADALSERLLGKGQLAMSFAVWDGSANNRGGRKQYANWVPLRIEP